MSTGVVMNGGGGSNSDVWGRGRRGVKRAADESSFNDFERFEKRLRLLSLREQQNGRRHHLYTPVTNLHEPHQDATTRDAHAQPPRHTNHMRHTTEDEHMHLDDRPDRVYIHDLDAELASDTESDSERLIFLPDIEKRFSRLPDQVLHSSSGDSNQEMVLYSVPKSLSIDEPHDSVRKAIIEARARAREKAVEDARERQEEMERSYGQGSVNNGVESAHGYGSGYGYGDMYWPIREVNKGGVEDEDGDEDAMEID